MRMVGRIGWLVLALALGVSCGCANVAGAIAPGRAYEMVSPLYKGKFGANSVLAVAPDGESVVFTSDGAFAGAQFATGTGTGQPYLARRGSLGWDTESIVAPASIGPAGTQNFDFSSDLGSFVNMLVTGIHSEGEAKVAENKQVQFWSRSIDTPAEWQPEGSLLKKLKEEPGLDPVYIEGSANLSHLIFSTSSAEPLLAAAEGAKGQQLYELVDTGEGTSSLRLVTVNDKGELLSPECPTSLGVEVQGLRSNDFNAVSSSGETVFFSGETPNSSGNCRTPTGLITLFARIGGAQTVQVSRPLSADCAESAPCHAASQQSAYFQGADEAGNRVFFTTTEPLVSEDIDEGNDLYMATIGCGGGQASCAAVEESVVSLTQVSRSAHRGEPADVKNAIAVSPDGSRVYFVAQGALSAGANVEGKSPMRGADNLYVADAAAAGGAPVFIAQLCSGPERSGEVKDGECPAGLSESEGPNEENDTRLWVDETPEVQTAGGEGQSLVFTSYGRLVPGDANEATDVYLYDAATGRLSRVSIGEDGFDANGNAHREAPDGGVRINRSYSAVGNPGRYQKDGSAIHGRAVSEDGSRVIFLTAAPLSPAAINGVQDLYEWRAPANPGEAGSVSLVSSGIASEPIEAISEPTMSSTGSNIFFVTGASLVPQDTDGGAPDVYDARTGGGFPELQAPPRPCSGDACQGPLSAPASLPVPESASLAESPSSVPAPQAKMRKAASKAKCERARRRKRDRCAVARRRRVRRNSGKGAHTGVARKGKRS